MNTPQFLVVGNAARDLVPGGWRLGGTISFAAVQAHRLGYTVGIITRAGAELDVAAELPFAAVVQLSSPQTTVFENVYHEGHRTQHIRSSGAPIEKSDIPDAWRAAPIVLLGPVWAEISAGAGTLFDHATLVGVSAQGWLRSSEVDGRVVHAPWHGDPFWTGCDVIFVSDEDLADGEDVLERWAADVPVIAMTESWRGLRVYADGHWRRMPSFPEDEVDPTGAGDTFATAFLIRLHETGDIEAAARFGSAAASLSVSGIAATAIPSRAEIEQRMQRYPEVALR
jgi:sugar/nucleoside kinase (ribokinase family)